MTLTVAEWLVIIYLAGIIPVWAILARVFMDDADYEEKFFAFLAALMAALVWPLSIIGYGVWIYATRGR